MIFLLLYFFNISESLSGCNKVHPQSRKSICYENWRGTRNNKNGLQCCFSKNRDNMSVFEVPIIILQDFTPFNFNCLRSYSNQRCTPRDKCLPKNLRDIQGFFNFLDILKSIPSKDSNDTPNWNCYNTYDEFESQNFSPKNDNFQTAKIYPELKNRLNKNFCRSILFFYFTTYGRHALQKDLCEDNFDIFPSHKRGKSKRFRVFNPLKQTFQPLCWVNDSSQLICSNRPKLYIKHQLNNSIHVFSNHYQQWTDFGVSLKQFQTDVNTYCGCFR